MSITEQVSQDAQIAMSAYQQKRERLDRRMRLIMPISALMLAVMAWEFLVWYNEVPHYLIPAPSLIAQTLWTEGPSLLGSAWFTVKLTLMSLGLAIVGGVLLGMLFALSRTI
ncbi:MAG: hypothetical protein ABJD83_23105, partial [Roseobacter sp.]